MITQDKVCKLPKGFYYFIVLFLCSLLVTSCASRKIIVHGIEEREANEIVVLLNGKNIDAQKVQSTEGGGGGAQKEVLWDITVNAEDAQEAMQILSQNGFPRKKSESLLGLFTNTGLVPSEMAEKIRYQAGLGEQIASVIRKIDGVLDASVQISYPEVDPLTGKAKGAITAAVYVKHNGVLDDPNSQLVTKIKRLVSGSVTGLDIDNVTLIADRARYGETPQVVPAGQEEKDLVSVWSLIIAKESLTRFRVIFFSFILINIIILISLVWVSWKIYPILKKHGGMSSLFHLHPLEEGEAEAAPVEKEEGEEEESEDEDEDDEEDENHTDKSKDVT